MNLKKTSVKERGYLLGLYEGDGYIYHNLKDRHYTVEFFLNSERDKDIIKFVHLLLKKLELNPFLIKDKRFNCMKIKVNSKDMYNFINQDYQFLLNDKDFAIGFLSGFIDAEGNVSKNSLRLTNTDMNLMSIASNILTLNSIKSKISLRKKSVKDTKPIYSMYISVKFKSLDHISLKAERLHSGVEIPKKYCP
jgi:hypothetical protein